MKIRSYLTIGFLSILMLFAGCAVQFGDPASIFASPDRSKDDILVTSDAKIDDLRSMMTECMAGEEATRQALVNIEACLALLTEKIDDYTHKEPSVPPRDYRENDVRRIIIGREDDGTPLFQCSFTSAQIDKIAAYFDELYPAYMVRDIGDDETVASLLSYRIGQEFDDSEEYPIGDYITKRFADEPLFCTQIDDDLFQGCFDVIISSVYVNGNRLPESNEDAYRCLFFYYNIKDGVIY